MSTPASDLRLRPHVGHLPVIAVHAPVPPLFRWRTRLANRVVPCRIRVQLGFAVDLGVSTAAPWPPDRTDIPIDRVAADLAALVQATPTPVELISSGAGELILQYFALTHTHLMRDRIAAVAVMDPQSPTPATEAIRWTTSTTHLNRHLSATPDRAAAHTRR